MNNQPMQLVGLIATQRAITISRQASASQLNHRGLGQTRAGTIAADSKGTPAIAINPEDLKVEVNNTPRHFAIAQFLDGDIDIIEFKTFADHFI